jgi:hypothetical protein
MQPLWRLRPSALPESFEDDPLGLQSYTKPCFNLEHPLVFFRRRSDDVAMASIIDQLCHTAQFRANGDLDRYNGANFVKNARVSFKKHFFQRTTANELPN